MHDFFMHVIDALKNLGYIGIVLMLTIETIPGELILPLAGYWVQQGDFNLWLTILSGVIGGVTGPLTLYALGRYGGRPLVLKYGKYVFIKEKQINTADAFFRKYGSSVAFFARFVPGVRTAISIPCGMTKMNIGAFIIYTFIAMIPITSLYVYIGMKLGENWNEVGSVINPYLRPLGYSILIGTVFFIAVKLYRKFKEKRRDAS
ncbi:alkaline phosphatase [Priestia megaterium]|nr:alkaline phosphatase [Priestia megaterium]